MPTTKVLLVTGDQVEVDGSVGDVAKALENAARSSAGTFAWLREVPDGEPLGINAARVVTIRPGDD
jgi:hypothetical protein